MKWKTLLLSAALVTSFGAAAQNGVTFGPFFPDDATEAPSSALADGPTFGPVFPPSELRINGVTLPGVKVQSTELSALVVNLILTDDSASVVADTTVFTEDAEAAVTQWYRDFLNRDPDAGGLAYWTNQLLNGEFYEVRDRFEVGANREIEARN